MLWRKKSRPCLEATDTSAVANSPFVAPQTFLNSKIADAGEDGPVLATIRRDGAVIALAVFDGLGGSGARIIADGAEQMTSAAYASRLAALIVRETLGKHGFQTDGAPTGEMQGLPLEPELLKHELHSRLVAEFRRNAEKLDGQSAPLVRGSLSKRLPTTICMLFVDESVGGMYRLVSVWAGDSRAYLWTPTEGLVQLTTDHTRKETDALTAILDDTPISNLVSADTEFYLDLRSSYVTPPFLAFVATDGVFQYFSSPMEFEEVILANIVGNVGWSEAISAFEARVKEVTNDDSSFAISGAGWPSWESLRASADARARTDLLPLLAPLLSAKRQLAIAEASYTSVERQFHRAKQFLRETRLAAWEKYRGHYERDQTKRNERTCAR